MVGPIDREGAFAPLVDEVVACVGDGLSVHLVGLHGSGRTELLGLVADRLDDDGTSVVRLSGNAAWRQEPFAALISRGVGAAPATGRSAGEMSAALAERLRGGVVVLVDDADDLDVHTVGALLGVAREAGLTAVTSSRPQVPARRDSLVLALTPAARLRMPILDFDAVHGVCRAVLGGPVDAGTVARIAMMSGGLHGLVKAIATVGRRSGALRPRDGVWVATGQLWSEHLASAVMPYLAGSDEQVWAGATTLALSGPLPLEDAGRLVDRRLLDRLFTSGLVHHAEPEGVVGLFPPLLTEFLRREGSPFGLAHAEEVTGHARRTGRVGGFDAGHAAGMDGAVRNAMLVRRAEDDAERTRTAWELDPSPAAALEHLIALRVVGAPPSRILDVADRTRLDAGSEEAATVVAWLAYWRAIDQADLAGALGWLDEHGTAQPGVAALFRAAGERLTYLCERVPTDAPEVQREVSGVPEGSPAWEVLVGLHAELLISAGDVDRAREVLAAFRPRHRLFLINSSVLTGLAAVLDGDLEGGIAHAREHLELAKGQPAPGAAQAHAYVAVLGLAISGRLAEASHLLFQTLSLATIASFRDLYHTGILGIGAEIAVAQGRPEYARALAAQAAATDTGTGPYPGMDLGAFAALLPGAAVETRANLWQRAHDRLDRGYLPGALFLAARAAELSPDEEQARPLADRGAEARSRLLRSLGRYVRAVTTEDEPALAAIADEFAAFGAGVFAVRAQVSRALVLRARGEPERAVQIADAAWQASSIAGYDRAGLFDRLRDDVDLSPRELELLMMLAGEGTTADIARSLQLSLRTVETHVRNIGLKVGVGGRAALTRAGSTWLREPR